MKDFTTSIFILNLIFSNLNPKGLRSLKRIPIDVTCRAIALIVRPLVICSWKIINSCEDIYHE
jgi:hypothetical protein